MNRKNSLGFSLFKRAFRATKHEIWVSLQLLLISTAILVVAMWMAESRVNNDYNLFDAIVWAFVKYVEDPADIASPPVTAIGQIVGTMVGIIGIAIFAVPAGLIGSGLTTAMDEEKREEELKECHKRICKSFRRNANKTLREYLNAQPNHGGEQFAKLNIVPQYIPVVRLQVRQAIDQKDIFDVCNDSFFDTFRLKNLAEARSQDEDADDRIVIEHFPLNRPYGCCINRKSKVTIVATSSSIECGTGWWAYHLAKFGGFNFVSKDLEADPDELDSFFNMSAEPMCDRKKRSEFASTDADYKQTMAILDRKEQYRKEFLTDIKNLCASKDSWVILISTHLKNSSNNIDFHLAHCKADGSCSTLIDAIEYDIFTKELGDKMKTDLDLTLEQKSLRYCLSKNNLLYRLQEEGVRCNGFVMRPAAQFVNFDNRNLVGAIIAAQIISKEMDGSKGIDSTDLSDFSNVGYGYCENEDKMKFFN